MIHVKEPKERRRNVERRIRYAIRKAHDRMFAPLQTSVERDRPRPQDRERH